jgi:chemotaxis protein CheD
MATQLIEVVEMGQILAVTNRSVLLHIPTIGASMAVILYDTAKHLVAVAHIVLPDSTVASPNSSAFGKPKGASPDANANVTGKFADTAIPALLQAFTAQGGDPEQLDSIRLVGGAQMFNFGGGSASLLNVGGRNEIAIRTALSRVGLPVHLMDCGGNKVRDLRIAVASGQALVQQIGEAPKVLAIA